MTAIAAKDVDRFIAKRASDRIGLVIFGSEAFTQCPKALVRSDLWNPERHIDRSELPSSGAIMKAVADPELDAEQYDRERSARYARGDGLY